MPFVTRRSVFDASKSSPLNRRSRLIRATRRAFLAWGTACERYHALCVTSRADCPCIDEAKQHANHLLHRYEALETTLSDASDLTRSAVYNQISASWPIVPALLANLWCS